MDGVICRRQGMFLRVAAALAALLLIGALPVQAGSPVQQGGKVAPLELSAQNGRQGGPAFADKATGDWWGERQRVHIVPSHAGVLHDFGANPESPQISGLSPGLSSN